MFWKCWNNIGEKKKPQSEKLCLHGMLMGEFSFLFWMFLYLIKIHPWWWSISIIPREKEPCFRKNGHHMNEDKAANPCLQTFLLCTFHQSTPRSGFRPGVISGWFPTALGVSPFNQFHSRSPWNVNWHNFCWGSPWCDIIFQWRRDLYCENTLFENPVR